MSLSFLSSEYLAAGAAVLAGDAEVQAAIEGTKVSLVYEVRDAPEGQFSYYIKVADGEVGLARGGLEDPSATIKSTYETAAKIARKDLSNQVAFLTGKVKISGNLGALMRHNSTLDLIQERLSGLDTTY